MAVIVPGPEYFAEAMEILVKLSGDAKKIKATTDTPTLGLVVSDELYDAWLWHTGTLDLNDPNPKPEPMKRRGRPRKVQTVEVLEAENPVPNTLPDPVPVFESAPTEQEDTP